MVAFLGRIFQLLLILSWLQVAAPCALFCPLQIPWASAWLPFDPSLARTRVRREILVCSSLTNQHCLKGARGTSASSPRSADVPIAKLCSLFHWPAEQIAPLLLHCLNICSPQVLDKLAISNFASSNERMLTANYATKGCNKVTRSGRKIEQNEVPICVVCFVCVLVAIS